MSKDLTNKPTNTPIGGAPENPYRCLGTLYFSSVRFDNGKAPVCAGFKNKLDPSKHDVANIPRETVPAGDFKYFCLGYSAFDLARIEEQRAQKRTATDPVDLPYCEGVEIISAAEFQTDAAVVGREGAGAAAAASSGPATGEISPVQPQASRSFPVRPAGTGDGDGFDWQNFEQKMQTNAGKILKQVGVNMSKVYETASSTISKVWDLTKPRP